MSLLLVCGGVFTAVTYGGDTDVKSGEEEQIDEKYITHEMTESEIKELKKDVGVKDPDKDYNEIVDGHGTGWAPPSEEDYGSMKGSTFVDDVSSDKDDLRASRDLTTKKYFPPVGNQGSQGSCAAWATGYYTNTFAQARAYDYDASSGNDEYRMSPAWIYNHVNGGEDSGATLEGCSEHVDTVGSSNWANMPYDQYDHTSWGSESAWRNAPKYRTSEFIKTHVSNTDVIKSWVNSSKLVSFAMDSNQYDWSDDDILSSQEYDAGNPNHAQTIVGYDDSKSDDGEQGAYKVVNSWGETWGPNGDGSYWMTYDCLATLEYDVVTSYEGTEYNQTNSNSPELLARWHHTSPGPRDASIELGSGEYSSPKDVRVPSYGKDTSNDYPAFMALDVSEFSDEWNGGRGEERFYLDVRSSSGTSSIDTFKMEFYDNGYTAGSPDMTSDNAYDAPGDSPTTLHLRFKGPGGSDGLAYLDQDKYYIEDTLNVTVEDTDLEGQSSVAVNVTSDTEPSGESLSLSVSSFDDVFTGSIDVSATDSDNVLQVSSGDQITLTYQDSDTGDGSSADKTDQAVVDTTAPSITGGPNVNNKLATLIEWQTNEPSTSRVNYGATKPLGKTSSSSELVSSHSLAVEDLTPGRTYYFEMISTDEAGNTIRDNNSGNYYTFTAGGVDNIEAGDVGWHPDQVRYGSRPWDVRDRKAKSGSYSWNLGNGTYDNALSENLTSPVIDASNWNEKNLTWYHNYSMESGWDGSVVEVNDGSGWTRVTPEGGYDAPLDGSSSYDPDSPLANQDAFTGSSSGWEMETVDLNSFLPTPNLQVRFWFASDAYVGQRGWNIDNVKISGVNMAPSSPTNPSPNNGAIDVSATEVDLSVDVRDPDGDPLDVSFYDSSNTLIGEETGVPSGSTASVTWSGLEEGTEYSWYAEASDGVTSSQSNIWSFTTPQNVQLSSGGESEGWNLISFGLQPQDNSISSLLDNQTDGIVGNYDKAMYFDSGDESWKTYIPDRADHYNDLENWDRSMGIWVHMTENDNLTVKGNIPSPTDITLEPGWNLVGYPSKTSAAADSVLPSQVTEIGTLDPTSPYNINYTTDLSSVTLSPNKGYWVYNSGSTSVTWTVSYS